MGTENKYIISMLTWCSLLLFIILIVTASLTPLSSISKVAGEFDSSGMYAKIIFVIFFYLVPYVLYLVGIPSIKYVMAILCSIGCLIAILICLAILFAGFWMNEPFYYFIIPLIVSSFLLCINFIWFIAAFVATERNENAI